MYIGSKGLTKLPVVNKLITVNIRFENLRAVIVFLPQSSCNSHEMRAELANWYLNN